MIRRGLVGLAAGLALAAGGCAAPNAAPSTPTTPPERLPSDGEYSLEEVAAHAGPEDCWTVVAGVVYDMSGYEADHPGGRSTIIGMCGRDATDSYSAIHRGPGRAADELAAHRIGVLTE